MTVMQIDMERGMSAARAALVRRVVYIVAAVVAVAWTILWLPPMLAGVRAQTEIGANGLDGVPSAHAVFELIFVASHWGIRWFPVVLLAALTAYGTRRFTRAA